MTSFSIFYLHKLAKKIKIHNAICNKFYIQALLHTKYMLYKIKNASQYILNNIYI